RNPLLDPPVHDPTDQFRRARKADISLPKLATSGAQSPGIDRQRHARQPGMTLANVRYWEKFPARSAKMQILSIWNRGFFSYCRAAMLYAMARFRERAGALSRPKRLAEGGRSVAPCAARACEECLARRGIMPEEE